MDIALSCKNWYILFILIFFIYCETSIIAADKRWSVKDYTSIFGGTTVRVWTRCKWAGGNEDTSKARAKKHRWCQNTKYEVKGGSK